jgi:5'-deoxynucleotidase YfbR-like HD superfamily hydrolase
MTPLQRILQARAGGAVQRCHIVRHSGSYSNAEHSWGVAMLLLQLFPDRTDLLPAALSHDVPETLWGDTPTTVKPPGANRLEDETNRQLQLPAEGDLSPEDHRILKGCDKLELYLWAREQCAQGNLFALELVENLRPYFYGDVPAPVYGVWSAADANGSVLPDRNALMALVRKETNT